MAWYQCAETIRYRNITLQVCLQPLIFPTPIFYHHFPCIPHIFPKFFLVADILIQFRDLWQACARQICSHTILLFVFFFCIGFVFSYPRWKRKLQLNFQCPKKIKSRPRPSWPPLASQLCIRCQWAKSSQYLFQYLLVSQQQHQMASPFSIFMSQLAKPCHSQKIGFVLRLFYDGGCVWWPNQFLWI